MKITHTLLTLILSFPVYAASTSQIEEINFLLKFIETTNCEYERNGKRYTGEEAVKHINKKYEYFKEKIITTEDFIKYSASKSKISDKYYMIHCANVAPQKSKNWLLKELHNYRNKK